MLGLIAARLGMLLGNLPGPWSVGVGMLVAAAGVWLWRSEAAGCGLRLPAGVQQRLASSGLWGALLLGALIGTAMSPCATPAQAAALALMQRFSAAERWLPGRRSFAALLGAAGLWWAAQGLGFVV